MSQKLVTTAFLTLKIVNTAYLLQNCINTRLSIDSKDLLDSSTAPQVVSPCYSNCKIRQWKYDLRCQMSNFMAYQCEMSKFKRHGMLQNVMACLMYFAKSVDLVILRSIWWYLSFVLFLSDPGKPGVQSLGPDVSKPQSRLMS